MRIYAKRKTKNKIKQFIKRLAYWILILIGILWIENQIIEFAKAFELKPKIVEIIFDRKAEASENEVESNWVTSQKDNAVDPKNINTKAESADGTLVLIEKYFGSQSQTALKIARCESQLNPKAIGDGHLKWNDGRNGMSCGLFQIRVFPDRPSCEELLDAETNIKFAKQLFDKSGWNPWTCANQI